MGYEVLDTDGGQVNLPQGSVPPSDVVDLTDLPDPEPAGPGAGRRPAGQSGEAGSTPWTRFERSTSWPGRTSTGWLAGLLSVALLTGAVAGGLWAHHHSTIQQDAELAGRLSVVAIVTNVDAVRAQRVADFTVKVVNAGPLPLELVPSPPGARATSDRPVIRALGGAVTVPANGSLSANVRVGVDCSSSADPVHAVRIPLRTSDGEVHQVAVAEQSNLDSGYSAPSPCSSPDDPALVARLGGSIAHPLLMLHNTSHRDLAVSLDLEHSPFIAQSTNFSVLKLIPPLPRVLGPGESAQLALTLTPWACPRNLAQVAETQLSPYVVLRAGEPDAAPLIQEPIGLDLSTLWGAALARECS